jgi:hypothetical protein
MINVWEVKFYGPGMLTGGTRLSWGEGFLDMLLCDI